jgi:hypothetical protein
LIGDLKGVGSRNSRNFCYEFELGSIEEFFINRASNTNTMRGFRDRSDISYEKRDILNFSMQGKVERRWVTGVVNKFVRSWVSGKFESTANHPFIKSFEPTESAPAFQVDVGWMDDLFDWGIPT